MRARALLCLLGILVSSVLNTGCSSWIAAIKGDDSEQGDQAMADKDLKDQRDQADLMPGRSPASASALQEQHVHWQNGAWRPLPARPRATKEDFVDKSQDEGSLWASSGQTNYYFTKNRIRSPGDIVSLVVEDDLYRQIVNEIRQTFSIQEQKQEVALLREEIKEKLLNSSAQAHDSLVTSSAAPQKAGEKAPEKTPNATPSPTATGPKVETPQVAGASSTAAQAPGAPPAVPMTPAEAEKIAEKYGFADVDILPLLDLKSGEKFMGEIVQRYPNGNYQIRGTKRVNYKRGESRNVTVLGVVKAAEINEETDVVASGKLYETQIDISR